MPNRVELLDNLYDYNNSLEHFNSCYNLLCTLCKDNSVIIDLVDSIIKHCKRNKVAETNLAGLGISKEEIIILCLKEKI